MSGRVLALVHDVSPGNRVSVLGTLGPAFEQRGFGVDIHDVADPGPAPSPEDYDAVCVTGSPESVYDDSVSWIGAEARLVGAAVDSSVPVMGVCFGSQLLATVLGGTVRRSEQPEHGFTWVRSTRPDLVSDGPWFEFHHDTVTVPTTAEVIAENDAGVQAFVSGPHLGVQFHPEITPDCFSSWLTGFDGARSDLGDDGVDLDHLAHAIAGDADVAAQRCDQLVERFLDHAGLTAARARPGGPRNPR
ncbi:type 1 glutamine amidotransferase [Gordonia sp. zg691]|uniref:Type 1 glutamine amidotransferase n=1 Tax=Gordonia jinghuaiqii TaxID=2758710 RepID=A0A7D7LXX6_9ACTN|nr:type 1 glutamine amidotransferase [Gordonia jinghuaiqii]MBD0860696.1 type 1 glutamine amidotransferase [Gordonia jinghuaiqii]MCR5978039.1 type 1 glutamine amidotransferase [Gordonia jinghuaiqii]QMT01496.1 type 1 glutamine amidotransferase [Gordonia jinghuaiqii]